MRPHVWQVSVCLLETHQGLTFWKSKLQKAKLARQRRLPVATSLLTAAYVCPWPGAPFAFLQIKTSALPQWKEHFNEVLGDLLHFPLKSKFTQGQTLFWKSRSKKMMPLLWRLRKQPGGWVKMPVPLINIDWDCSEENSYIICCGWGDVEIQAGVIRQVSVRAAVTVVFLFAF